MIEWFFDLPWYGQTLLVLTSFGISLALGANNDGWNRND